MSEIGRRGGALGRIGLCWVGGLTKCRLDSALCGLVLAVNALRIDLEQHCHATLTPGARDFLDACRETGLPVAIVSNNCDAAVRAYLDRVGITAYAEHIEARDPTDPRRMKPSPYLVQRAADALRISPSNSVLIGDQPSDIQAAEAVGAISVGYANKPGKANDLATAGADALTDSMAELARAIRVARPHSSPPEQFFGYRG